MNPNIRKLIEKYEADRNIYLTDRYNELCCFKTLWDRFEDVSIDQDECIDKVFHILGKGTERFHIWHWFDERCPNEIARNLMGLNFTI